MLTRNVLWYVVFAGFGINYMHRIHINIALVAMVKHVRGSGNVTSTVSECITDHSPYENRTTNSVQFTQSGGFEWNERDQNHVLGSFFWLHWLTQIPGGMLARRFGTKNVFGLANFISCLITFILPIAAHTHINLLIFLRVLQGLITGVAWPSMHHLTAHWIPADERSKFVSSYLGSSIGVALTYPLCGFVMDIFGWEAAFYTTGIIGVIWYLCWLYLVYDTPALHPRISKKEHDYIQNKLALTLNKRELPVPWKEVLLSRPLWMIAISQLGGIWGLYTLMTQAPTYFRNVLGLNIRMTGIFTGIPHITRWMFSFGSAVVADYLIKKQIMSRTNVRKLATSTCTIVQGIMILGLALAGCNSTVALLFLIAATAVNGAVSTGPIACVVDLSPNFAGVLLGIVNMAGNLPGFISPLIVGMLTYQNQTIGQWQKVYFISTAVLFLSGLLNLIYGEANIQPWNDGSKPLKDAEKNLNQENCDKEMKKIKQKNCDKEMKEMTSLIEIQSDKTKDESRNNSR